MTPMTLGRHRLLESLLWTPRQGYWLAGLHVARLRHSAECFGVALDESKARVELERFAETLTEAAKVRLTVGHDGDMVVSAVSLAAGPGSLKEPLKVGLCPTPVDATDPWLRHKTTRRDLYEAALRTRPECNDVLLHNQHAELTEASSSNLVVVLGGNRWTPPSTCGLLPGTLRRHLLEAGEIKERVLPKETLLAAEAIYLINSVRRWRRAELLRPEPLLEAPQIR